jgi:serine kinase of HPr protein (carbohydrate metabolism regulator)
MSEARQPSPYLHATAVMVGEAAVLIRGPSGAGKSQLALALLSQARRRGLFAALVGDDRVAVSVAGGRALVRGHPAVEGWIEERGSGLLPQASERVGVVRCVVDLMEAPPRLPEADAPLAPLMGVMAPALALWTGCSPEEGARRILGFLKWV